jgi:glycosyltransferase involved in cell wall biosynthesis
MVLIDLLEAVDDQSINPLVFLPGEGPLTGVLNEMGINYVTVPLGIISRSSLSVKGILSLLFNLIRSVYLVRKYTYNRRVDLVHSNTLAVLTGSIYSYLFKKRHIWHIHEILKEDKVSNCIFYLLTKHTTNLVIGDSSAVINSIAHEDKNYISKSSVIWNSTKLSSASCHEKLRKDKVVLGLVGRLSRIKGQDLLIESLSKLPLNKRSKILVKLKGDVVPGNEAYKEYLKSKVKEKGLSNLIEFCGFVKTKDLWADIDIALVPSVYPEAFGIVAIEAMANSLPVIAAGHGGLVEIVDHGHTGYLIKPGCVDDLYEKVLDLIESKEKRIAFGRNGYEKHKSKFSFPAFKSAILKSFKLVINN